MNFLTQFGVAADALRESLAESWNPAYAGLGFDPHVADPPFLKPAVEELAKTDRV